MATRRFFPEPYAAPDTLQVMGGTPHVAFGNKIDLLVWNMYKAKRKAWEHDFLALTKGRDLVLLQESVINTRFDAIFQTPDPFEWVMAKSHRSLRTLAVTGVKTGSNVKSSAQSFLASPDLEPLFKTPKMLLATTYPIFESKQTLLVINIHVINFVSFEKFCRQLDQIIATAQNHNGPLLLAGDFNTWNRARYQRLIAMAGTLGLQEVGIERKARLHHLHKHLDHIFFKGMELVGAEVALHIHSSDHYPILAEFKLPLHN